MDTEALIQLAYVVSAALFILGLKNMSHPRTAVFGNRLGAAGMLLAILVTMLKIGGGGFFASLVGLVAGSLIGAVLAWRIQMTSMPQLVALFNGLHLSPATP